MNKIKSESNNTSVKVKPSLKQEIPVKPKESVYQIYDHIFKRLFSLSNKAIINLINGLFDRNYPTDSTITYSNKEFVKKNLHSRIADVFISINGDTFHLEAMIEKDERILVRVMEYDFYYAIENQDKPNELCFPEPMVIYLNKETKVPPYSILKIRFGNQGIFEYKVKNFLYQEHDVEELNQKKMIILIPFQLLKLKKLIEKAPSKENFHLLRELIENDIIYSIEKNLQLSNITAEDASQLRELAETLYDHIYQQYEEKGGVESMKPLLVGALELPNDKYRFRIDELEEENRKIEEEKRQTEEENRKLRAEIEALKHKESSR